MNKQEKLILHGLYYDRQYVDEKKPYTANEIKWLAGNFCYRGKEWRGKDGELKSIEDEDEDYLASKNATSAAATRELTYLKDGGYISFTKEGSSLLIGVTVKGADLARELDTRFGPLNIWYKNHKDGLLGLLVTVVVSIVTTIVTNKYLQ
jgi:hypothetical protein